MDRDWIAICKVDDIPMLGARRVQREQGHCRWRSSATAENQVFALLDRCPHRGGPLSQGIVFGDSVACPLHNWTIGLDDGCARGEDVGCTPTFACEVDASGPGPARPRRTGHAGARPARRRRPGRVRRPARSATTSFDVQAPHTA